MPDVRTPSINLLLALLGWLVWHAPRFLRRHCAQWYYLTYQHLTAEANHA